ncbi:uncharacterized protein LOC116676763 [Lates japonicus]|uniref:BEN domain-containing protein n=1 Tax=Lates japonicus TaxID=270547 RepID=A0AAD3M9C1_LATJO|nr:uncharacterized protein AKAME5_002765000 [Lates japonicus]
MDDNKGDGIPSQVDDITRSLGAVGISDPNQQHDQASASSSSGADPPGGDNSEMVTLPGSTVTIQRKAMEKLYQYAADHFTQQLAAIVFTEKVLAQSAVKENPQEGKQRIPLDKAKVEAIIVATRHRFPEADPEKLQKAIQRKCYNDYYRGK